MSRRREAFRERPRGSVLSYLLASDEAVREEITATRREAIRNFENEKDREAWLDLEREVREHRRWRHLGALVFGPALVVVIYFMISFFIGMLTE